ncbi:MAG: hypothetical protein ACRDD1_21300, partial [Planctomycetia bacterium]
MDTSNGQPNSACPDSRSSKVESVAVAKSATDMAVAEKPPKAPILVVPRLPEQTVMLKMRHLAASEADLRRVIDASRRRFESDLSRERQQAARLRRQLKKLRDSSTWAMAERLRVLAERVAPP